ncbi:hypothetical protein Ahy_A08g040886 isoform A [Arachis hypogaea]|uniref:Zinc knuckle CX2CX4HX4C domain-containing protein n=1 Tax=Arachis hypogaea TaxID=3818 RepID=A0A445C0X8_ARAHY|nr:hypothetical protein Ahy_A08g040886 isoform A [Arachis hypogaea]
MGTNSRASTSLVTMKTTEIIGKRLGVVMKTKNPRWNNIFRKTFLRVKVTLNVTKPLPTGFWLARDNFHDLWVDFKYEKIQDSYCLNCRILGHNKRECKNPMTTACWDPMKLRYAPGLGVNRAKAISARNTEQREDENRESTNDKQACEGERVKMETMKEKWAVESCKGNRAGRGFQRTLEPNLEQQKNCDRESQGSWEQINKESESLSFRRAISENKHSEFGERPAVFINRMTKGKDKVRVAEEDNWDARQHNDGDQDHAQAKENKEVEPFGMGTTKNELELAWLMVIEIEIGNLQVNEGEKDNNRCLTIREELNKLFGRKGSSVELSGKTKKKKNCYYNYQDHDSEDGKWEKRISKKWKRIVWQSLTRRITTSGLWSWLRT